MNRLWVSTTFSDIYLNIAEEVSTYSPIGGARKRTPNLIKTIWSNKYEPKRKQDLAINSKKIQEVYSWLARATAGAMGDAPIAVLSGPTGCGKTTTLRIFAKHLNVTVKEWITPVFNTPGSMYEREGEMQPYTNQISQFEEFLFRASRYVSVCETMNPNKCLLLVEDIPNVFLSEPRYFDATLRNYKFIGRSPLVIICASGKSEFNLEKLLFKEITIGELNIRIIRFNPVSRTLMMGALRRIIELGKCSEPSLFEEISEEVLEAIVDVSHSDIRFAVNQLQYICCGDQGVSKALREYHVKYAKSIKSKCIGQGNKTPDCDQLSTAGKDNVHDVFKCLGRVLYSKKKTEMDEKTKNIKECLIYDPLIIVDMMTPSSKLFMDMLKENYAVIFNNIQNIAKAGSCLTNTDILMSSWKERNIAVHYGLYISSLGLMALSNDDVQRKWHPFRGSRLREVQSAYEKKLNVCREVFPLNLCDANMVLTDIVPYLPHLELRVLTPDQQILITSICGMASSRSQSESSDSKDSVKEWTFESDAMPEEVPGTSFDNSSDEATIEDCDSDA